MIITNLEELGNHKFKVYIDGEYAFLLYSSDLRRTRLEVGAELLEEEYADIVQNTIYRRAKQKAMAILKRMDRTEAELRMKLKQDYYTEDQIEHAINYVMSYGYVDDERYAKNYVTWKKGSKSRKEMQYVLTQKGVSKELILEALEEEDVDEEKTIQKLILKKTNDPQSLEEDKKRKLIASICRKGFSYEKVKKFF